MRQQSQEEITLLTRALGAYVDLTGEPIAIGDFERLLDRADPSPRKKHVRWIAERLASGEAVGEFDSWRIEKGEFSQIYRILMMFDASKRALPKDIRNILNYRSLHELKLATVELNRGRFKPRKRIASGLTYAQAYEQTLVRADGGISVHKPLCIEEALVLMCNDNLVTEDGDSVYAILSDLGEVTVFLSQGYSFIGATPMIENEKGVIYDSFGEFAMFEEMIMEESSFHEVDWESYAGVLKEMILIDPALPFDCEMTEPEPYQVALCQFPLVLHEDRHIPDDLLEAIVSDQRVANRIREAGPF